MVQTPDPFATWQHMTEERERMKLVSIGEY